MTPKEVLALCREKDVKAVDMLFAPAHLISTSQGVAGLSSDITKHFDIADDAETFARAVVNALNCPIKDYSAERAAARDEFSEARVVRVLSTMQHDIASYHRGSGQSA